MTTDQKQRVRGGRAEAPAPPPMTFRPNDNTADLLADIDSVLADYEEDCE